ncbi:hypothetical protein ACQPXH_05815 [Nocardia sp. CA-135953]|uniref:hypothetical protein n=1 Tax=Nocardia sp. CA-135953 TaxID=3239978 RepID=UPI003D953B65
MPARSASERADKWAVSVQETQVTAVGGQLRVAETSSDHHTNKRDITNTLITTAPPPPAGQMFTMRWWSGLSTDAAVSAW